MKISNVINSVGLVFDIIGVILLWRYGLPEKINRQGEGFLKLSGPVDEAEIQKGKWYDKMGTLGLALLILGFVLQLASNFISL